MNHSNSQQIDSPVTGDNDPGSRQLGFILVSIVSLCALAGIYCFFRSTSVPLILLLDVFDSQFVTQEPTGVFLLAIIAISSWFLTRCSGLPAQQDLLNFLGRHYWVLPLLVFIICAIVKFMLQYPLAVSGDEYANVLQTEIFSAGEIFGRWPTQIASQMVPAELSNRILLATDGSGRIVTSYQPVFAVLAAPFYAVGLGSFVNPLIAAIVVLMTGFCSFRIWNQSWVAGLAMLLMASSVSVYGFGVSMFATNLVLLLHLVFFWCVMGRSSWEFFLAGIAGGLAFHVGNQMPHLLVAAPFFLLFLRRREWRKIFVMGLPYVVLILIFSFGWTSLVQQVSRIHRTESLQGLGAAMTEVSWLWQNIAFPSFRQTTQDVMSLCRFFLWATPGLAGLMVYAMRRPVKIFNGSINGPIKLSIGGDFGIPVAGAIGLTALFYFLFPLNQGYGWGYRYMQPVLGFVILAAVSSVIWTGGRGRLIGWLVLSSLMTIGLALPLRLSQIVASTAARNGDLPCDSVDVHQICFVDTRRIYWGPDLVQNRAFVSLNDNQKSDGRIILYSNGIDNDASLVRNLWPSARLLQKPEGGSSSSVWVPAAADSPSGFNSNH